MLLLLGGGGYITLTERITYQHPRGYIAITTCCLMDGTFSIPRGKDYHAVTSF